MSQLIPLDEGKSRVDEEILDLVTTASFSDSVNSPSTPPINPFHSSDSEGSSPEQLSFLDQSVNQGGMGCDSCNVSLVYGVPEDDDQVTSAESYS